MRAEDYAQRWTAYGCADINCLVGNVGLLAPPAHFSPEGSRIHYVPS
jgi:hypothetical protein